MAAATYLYRPNTVVRAPSEPSRQSAYGTGHRRYYGTNPPRGAQIYYSLTEKAEKASVRIIDYSGRTVRELPGKTELGMHLVAWDLRGESQQRPAGEGQGGPAAGGGGQRGAGRRGGAPGQQAASGGTNPTSTPTQSTPPETAQPKPPEGEQKPAEGEKKTTEAKPAQGEQKPAEPASSGQRPPEGTQTGQPPAQGETPPSLEGESGQQAPAAPGAGPRGPIAIPAGMYRVVLVVDGKEFTQSLKIEGDPTPGRFGFGDEEEEDDEEWEELLERIIR